MIAGWAYNAGLEKGIVLGLIKAMSPDEKNRGAFRRAQIAARLAEYAANAEALYATRTYTRFWPKTMKGGWPLPPTVPSDDETTWWPEHDGWPCPPPQLRGEA
jgi:nicotinamidase-related amidase